MKATPEPSAPPNDAKTVGGGLLVITAAKLWFMVGGALITFGLPYLFQRGGQDGTKLYGQFVDINNTLSILSMVLVTGCLQAVSKWTSQFSGDPERAAGALRQLFWLMLGAAVVIGGGFVLASPWIATERGNPDLVNAYRAAGVVLVAYALYVVYIGALNGRKRFLSQALFDISFTTLKAVLVLGAALLGWGVTGAFGGFALAAILIALAAAWRVGLGPRGVPSPAREVYGYALQVMLYTLVFNMIFKLDLLMVKPAAQALAARGGLGEVADVDKLMGLYGMAVNLSRLPWQATLAVTFVIFPLLSEATFAQDMERSRAYVRQTLRYLMLLIGLPSAALMALPQAALAFLPPDYLTAATTLAWCAPAYLFFSLFNLCNTLLMSAGRATAALWIGCVTVGAAAAMYLTWLPRCESGLALVEAAAQASLAAFALGLALGLWQLQRVFGAPLALGSVGRLLVAFGAVWGAGHALAPYLSSKLLGLVGLCALGGVYVLALTLLGEWDEQDKARARRLLRRG
jgi:O-antigen/teichoic acid export membrane protein